MLDFGLRRLDFESRELGELVWLSDVVRGSSAAGDYSGQATLLLLNFFAVWCKPCFEELPLLDEWQRRYGSRGLRVVSVNVRTAGESSADAIAATLQKLGAYEPRFPLLFDRYTRHASLAYLGDEVLLPTNLLFDASGRVVLRTEGNAAAAGGALDAVLRATLGPADALPSGRVPVGAAVR